MTVIPGAGAGAEQLSQYIERIERLEEEKRFAEVSVRFSSLKEETIRLEEEKVIAEFRQQLIKVAFEKALTGIKSRMSPSLHRKYIDAKIALMSSRL